ncbi:hypothetical protein HDU87_008863 [Geranomyces variabilis]|uniref:Uncharacterized protein n=1 Tax=Geranomyces variabilis TaxID=109894 RepID=A0AAD5TE12_9FUNG|nr:hypothetical protein HDU87_008863 [Geranomyces variabilis]
MLRTEGADHPALRRQFLSRTDSALSQLDALLAELQTTLAALRSADKARAPETSADAATAESRLRELLEKLKPDCVYLDQGAWILDMEAKLSTQTLEACLQRCYQLQDLLADVGISQETRSSISKTLPSITPSGSQDANAMDES